MLEQDSHAPTPGGRDWLAALLLRRQSRLMPRLAVAFARLRAAPRNARRRLHRRAAVSLGGAALLLALSGSPLLIPSAQAATITVANGAIAVNDDNICSLIEAIINANDGAQTHDDCVAGEAGADTVNLPAGGLFTFTASYVSDDGSNGLPTITSDITINGNGSTLDLGGSGVGIRLAQISGSGDLTVNDATISDGSMFDATFGGGIFRVDGGDLTLDNSTLTDSATRSYGGAVFGLDGATLTITDSTLSGNQAFRGGAVYGSDSTVTLTNSTLSGNTANRSGAGVQVNGGDLSISGGIIEDNGWEPGQIGTTGYVDYGGGVFAHRASVNISGTVIRGNYGGYAGGGGVRLGDVTDALIDDATITGNTAGSGGGVSLGAFGDGAIFPVTGVIRDSVIDGNTATYYGGGVSLIAGSTVSILRTTISNNVAENNFSNSAGGGVANFLSDLTIEQSTLADNNANNGGGLLASNYSYYGNGDGSTTVTNTTISGNTATGFGGGVMLMASPVATLNNVTISDNEAQDGGGLAFYNEQADANTGSGTLNRTLIVGNSASENGDEVLAENATLTANNFNLFGHNGVNNASALAGFTPGATDITATSDGSQPTALSAIVDALADNGGPTTPATKTHALDPGSPARDRAPNAACAAAPVDGVDQRDVARNQDGDGAASANECDVGAYEAAFTPPVGICLAPENERTTILGVGMGSPKKASLSKKLTIPNSTDLVALYGQLAGKDVGKDPRFVRFTPQGGGTVQVNTMTGTSQRNGGVYWYGTPLQPTSSITGRWFLAPKTKGKVPRALVAYATYETAATYFDTYVLYTDGATNTVGPEEPWAQSQTLTIPIDPPLATADVTVQVALVDNDKDTRFITVNASAGPVMEGNTSNNPTHGDTLSILTFTLEDVPAGTDEVTLELLSGVNGDSAAIVGAAASYACNP